MKTTHVLLCLVLLAADIALPLAGATHTTETEVPLGPTPQLEEENPVPTDIQPVEQAQEDLMELVGPPANEALVTAYAAYHAGRAELEKLSSRGLIQPYRDGMGGDARDGASELDPDLRLGGFGEWRVIGDPVWGIREEAARTGVAGYTSATRADGTYGSNVRSLLLSPELDLRTGVEPVVGAAPGNAANSAKEHLASSDQPQDALYEFSFSARYNIAFRADQVNVLVFTSDPGKIQPWDHGTPNEDSISYGANAAGITIPGARSTGCVHDQPPCWEFVEPMGSPYQETNDGIRAFTGRSAEWTTYHLDLSEWAEQSIWIGFSFKTGGTPAGYFENPKLFEPDLGFYGFQFDDARLEIPTQPYSLRVRAPELPTAQVPSAQTRLDTSLATVPADEPVPLTFDAANMGLEPAQVAATVRLYKGLDAGGEPVHTQSLDAITVPPGRVARFEYALPPLENPSSEGTKHTVEVVVENQDPTYRTLPVDPDADPADNTQRLGFNVITFEDVHAGRLSQSSTFAGFGEPVTFELPVRNLGNEEVTVDADACGVDLLAQAPTCSGELFSHGEGTQRTVVLAPGAEHTFQWVAKGNVAGQHRIFARAGTAIDTVPGFSPDDLRTDLLPLLRSRYVDAVTVDGSTEGEDVWLQAPNPTLPGGGSLRILNSDTHLFLAVEGQATLRLLLDDLADHRVLPAHDGGVLASLNAGEPTGVDLQLDPDGLGWSASTGEETVSAVAYDADEGQYEIALPLGVAAGGDAFSGLTAAPGDFVGLILERAGSPYPQGARSSDSVNGNGDLTDELYVWQPVHLGTPDDVVSDDTVRRFQFRGLSAGLGIERSPPSILQEDFQQCPDMSQWVQENIEVSSSRTEKWNCAEYGPDRRLVLYEGLSPDSTCDGEACPPWSMLGSRTSVQAQNWKGDDDSGVVYTPPFRIDSQHPYLFLQHQYATEGWIVDVPGFAGDATDPDNHYGLGWENPNVRTNSDGVLPRTQQMLYTMSAGRVYVETWDEDANEWGTRVLVRPDGGYTTDEDVGIVDPRLDDQRHIILGRLVDAKVITTDAEGVGFWWPTGRQPLYQPVDEDVATGGVFAGSPWSFHKFPLFGTHMPFQGSVFPGEAAPGPEGLDLLGKTVRLAFDFQRSEGDGQRDYGWRIGGIAVADGERFQRDLSVDEVRTGQLLYDPTAIGVGPGTELPVVATLSNQGSSDLPGISISLRGTDAQDPEAAPLCTQDQDIAVSIAAGESREFELTCALPADREGALLLLQVEASPRTGDDFPANNRRNAGDLFELRSTPDVAVQVTADPSVASRDVRRTVTIVVENRGNVPVSDFDVSLQMQQVTGVGDSEALGAPTTWHVNSVLPVNTRLRLDDPRLEAEPSVERKQLTFKPPEQGVYDAVARVSSEADADPSNDAASATMRARSLLYRETLDQIPFTDPSTVSGERDLTGTRDVWSVQGGSHDGSKRLLAGDPRTEEIPADASASILLPDLDLTTVKGSTLTLKHRYALEEGFDGARLEISADDGTTWRGLRPQGQPLGDLPEGYPSITMLGVNPLLDGKAEATAVAFTGNSADLNASETDAFGRRTGWITSEFELSDHPDLQRWTAIDAFSLHGFGPLPEGEPETTPSGERQFRHATWTLDEPGAEGNQRYWWIQDATSDLAPHSGDAAWWSGTAGTEAEGLQGVDTLLTYDVDVPEGEDGRRVYLSWWEYRAGSGATADRRGTGGEFSVQVGPPVGDLAAHAAHGEDDLDGDYLDDDLEPTDPTRLGTEYDTDPTLWDTDDDGLADNQESAGPGSNLLFHTRAHEECDTSSTSHLPVCDQGYATDPTIADTDEDTWLDGAEIRGGSSPSDRLSVPDDEEGGGVGDGLADAWELKHFSSLAPGPGEDPDGDGLTNLAEQKYGTDPTHPDRDHDGLLDSVEVQYGLDPYGSDLPEAAPAVVEEDGDWVKREVDVTNHAGGTAFVRFYYKSIPGEGALDPARKQSNLGWFIDDIGLTSYNVDAATDLRTHPTVHLRDDVEDPDAPGWTVRHDGWHRADSPPDRGTVWRVEETDIPGQGPTPVWFFGDASDQGYPHSVDARLVTPLVDLSSAVGDEARISFDHRYGFEGARTCRTPECNTGDTFVSALDGGVVEVQVFNETTGTFGDWQQIGARFTDFPQVRFEHLQTSQGPKKGPHTPNSVSNSIEASGYSAVEEKGFVPPNMFYKSSCSSPYVYGDYVSMGSGLPFTSLQGMAKWTFQPCAGGSEIQKRYLNWQEYGYSLIFSGDSDGWQTVDWDISPLIGKKVRFAFHTATNPSLTHPDTHTVGGQVLEKPYEGWSIANVAVHGNLFQGKPVQARLHLATDGSLTKGEWSVDDIELVGDRYENNLALIAESDTEVLADQGETVLLDGRVANIGINRRGALALAVQALDADKRPYDVTVLFDGEAPQAVPQVLLPTGTHQAFGPFSLNAGGQDGSSLPFHIQVELPEEEDVVTLRIQVLQANGEPILVDGSESFTYVLPDNEVSGNTLATWLVEGRTVTDLRVPATGAIALEPGAPRVGQQVRLSSEVENFGTTQPEVVARWSVHEVHRKGDPSTQPAVGPERSTEVLPEVEEDLGSIARKAHLATQQTFTPERPGLYRAVVEYVVDGEVQASGQWEFLVDSASSYYQVDFSTSGGAANWTDRSPEPDSTHGGSPDAIRFRHDGASLVWGVGAGQIAAGQDYCDFGGCVFSASRCSGPCQPPPAPPVTGLEGVGYSPPIDLGLVPQGEALVTLTHSMRFYPGDGARLEAVPYRQTPSGGYEPAVTCGNDPAAFVLYPTRATAYDGVAQTVSDPKTLPPIPMGDTNSYKVPERRHPFAVLQEGALMMESTRTQETLQFDLSVPAKAANKSCTPQELHLTNYTIALRLHAGERPGYNDPNGRSDNRVGSHGWQIHSVSVSSIAVDIQPEERRFPVLDGAPKSFGFNVHNKGQVQETFHVSLNEAESTLPEASWIRLSTDKVTLPAGDTVTVPFVVDIPPDPNLSRGAYTARLEARSASSPSIVDSIDVVLDLQSNPLPDLSVSLSMDDGGQTVTQGSISPVYVTVRNLGQVDSKSVRVLLVAAGEDGTEVPIDTLNLDTLCPQVECGGGSRRTLAADWLVPELTGPYTVTAYVDVDGRLLEETLHNNRASLLLEVVPLAVPDLAVTALEVEGVAVDGFAEEGDLLVYRATVENLGLADARNVQVQVLADSALLAEETIPVLAAGQSREVTAFKVGSRGETIALVHVLPDDAELDTDNNQFKQSVRVRGHDLAASLVPARPLLEPGGDATVLLNVSNGGNAVERVVVSLADAPGWSVSVTPDPLFVAPGRNGTASLRIHVPEDAVAGTPDLRLVVAPATNAGAAVGLVAPFDVKAVGGAPEMEQNGTVSAQPGAVLVALNVTSTTNAPQRVTLRLASPDWKHEPAALSLPPLAQAAADLSVSVPAGTGVGNHTLQVEAVGEDGKVLSQTVATVEVLEQQRVEADWSDVRTSRFADVGNQTYLVTLHATNTGNVPVELTLVPTDLGRNTSAQSLVGGALEPGAVQTLVLRVDSESDALAPLFGNVQVWMRAAGAEGRGALVRTLALPDPTDAPDLHVVRLDLSPRTLRPGETVQVSAVVENQGTLLSNASRLHVYLDGALLEDIEVPPVPPGENTAVNATWTVQRSGTFHVIALADAEGGVDEAEEANNGLSGTLEVEDRAYVPGFLERNVPALPLAPLLLALVLALARRRRTA